MATALLGSRSPEPRSAPTTNRIDRWRRNVDRDTCLAMIWLGRRAASLAVLAGIVALGSLARAAEGAHKPPWLLVVRPEGPMKGGDAKVGVWIGLQNRSQAARAICGDQTITLSVASGPRRGPGTLLVAGIADHACRTAVSWHLVAPGETFFTFRALQLEPLPPMDSASLAVDLIAEERQLGAAAQPKDVHLNASFSRWRRDPVPLPSPTTSSPRLASGAANWIAVVRPAATDQLGQRAYWVGLKNRSRQPHRLCGYLAVGSAVMRGGAEISRRKREADPDCREDGRRLVLPGETYFARHEVAVDPGTRDGDTLVLDFGTRQIDNPAAGEGAPIELRWLDRDFSRRPRRSGSIPRMR